VALPLQADAAGLERLANDAADPNAAQYRRFIGVPDIARRYGARAAVVSHDLRTLSADGIHLEADPTGAALWGTITAAQVQRHFGTRLVETSGIVEPAGTPRVPAGLTGITGVVGLTATATATSPAAGTFAPAAANCPPTIPTRASLARLFGFTNALANGTDGSGTSVDIVSTSAFEPGVLTAYDRCVHASLNADHITESQVPNAPPASGGDEVALDSLVLTLLAPRAHLKVIRFDRATPLAFPLLQLLSSPATTPNVLDITDVYCETQLGSTAVALSERVLAALAATGTTTVTAAGDSGSSGCYPPNRSPAVTYPASSAFAASVGGADYDGSAASPGDLRVWNEPGISGGGGGRSSTLSAPPWQPGPKRTVPDASAYAVPGGVGSIPVCTSSSHCEWTLVGGTSLAATVLGDTGLLLAQKHGTDSHPARWGNLAGLLWRRSVTAKAVRDITQGSNTTFDSACCHAKPGYDTASGWGLFNPDALIPGAASTGSTRH
jgi:subtilase family serine protease